MKAMLKNYHQSPRKVRLVADMIRGKSVSSARLALTFAPQKSTEALAKLLDSAVANARTQGASAEELFVKTIAVNKGAVLKRGRPFGRGRSGTLRKAMSIVTLELGRTASESVKKPTSAKKIAKSAPGRSASGGKVAKKVAKVETK